MNYASFLVSILQALNMAMNESPKISKDVFHLLCVCVSIIPKQPTNPKHLRFGQDTMAKPEQSNSFCPFNVLLNVRASRSTLLRVCLNATYLAKQLLEQSRCLCLTALKCLSYSFAPCSLSANATEEERLTWTKLQFLHSLCICFAGSNSNSTPSHKEGTLHSTSNNTPGEFLHEKQIRKNQASWNGFWVQTSDNFHVENRHVQAVFKTWVLVSYPPAN